MQRGLGVISSIYQVIKYVAFAGIIIEIINKSFGKYGIYIGIENVIYFVPVFVILLILVGIIDIKKIHALQKSKEIETIYNPFLVNLIKNNKTKEKTEAKEKK